MKIALLTEGVSEYQNLPLLYGQITQGTPHTLLKPLKVNITPDSAARVIARECKARLLVASQLGARFAVLIIDREQQVECPGKRAAEIESAIADAKCTLSVRVVLKDRKFENWLVADLEALRKQPRRFQVTASMVRLVEPNKADRCDGERLLGRAVRKGEYSKVSDSKKILAQTDLRRASSHSRSLRHLLHVLSYLTYKEQCRDPVGQALR